MQAWGSSRRRVARSAPRPQQPRSPWPWLDAKRSSGERKKEKRERGGEKNYEVRDELVCDPRADTAERKKKKKVTRPMQRTERERDAQRERERQSERERE